MESNKGKDSRRTFLNRVVAGGAVAATDVEAQQQPAQLKKVSGTPSSKPRLQYPRSFTGRRLSEIAFPLGGVAAGSISLGGRGNLRDWEIFNRADKGNNLSYALPAIWAKAENQSPVARVLEARYLPPYEGQNGLGSNNAPGLPRLETATFTGEYPLARVDFVDSILPVHVSLEAFSPFIPHDGDNSGLPVAVLRYKVTNRQSHSAAVSIAWSVENPCHSREKTGDAPPKDKQLRNEFRKSDRLSGLFMTNPELAETDTFHGSFVLCSRPQADGKLTYLRGWPAGPWWNSPLLFWDDFATDGQLGPEESKMGPVGAVCLSKSVSAGKSAEFEFLLAWHYPNRTPGRCGWSAPKGEKETLIGNWYCTKFSDAWTAAEYAATRLEDLERKTRLFATSLRESTLPPSILESASANISTLATTTCFRTADGEFHGFEGANDKLGCCFGNCTHVWNYETTTPYLFPSFARSLRKSAFGFSMDDAGAMHFRQLLPDGKERSGFAAADGQMGQIVHAYLDWVLSGDRAWLETIWPRIKKAISFAWVPGGWDADQDGVLEGVQHNTYDVEFYGPNPLCGIYYLAALRACAEMASEVGDKAFAERCRNLFTRGSEWIDAHLFNGEFYVQQVRSFHQGQIAPALRGNSGASDPEHPEYQVGKGCLVDQLTGQYLADVCGLGPLLKPDHIRRTLQSIHKYNYKSTLYRHDSVQRTFALNDEAALLVCDYANTARPHIPFPYFAEVFTGLEYTAATHMLFAGMLDHGVECIASIRERYDGERRNPWDEAECGHHYARAMSAWSGILALSGFQYHGGRRSLSIKPKTTLRNFRSFWSTGTGWGTFALTKTKGTVEVAITVHHGELPLQRCAFVGAKGKTKVSMNGRSVPHDVTAGNADTTLQFKNSVTVREGSTITLTSLS